MDQQEQIATLQTTVQNLYATLQEYSTKYALLYEENKTLKEKEGHVVEKKDAAEVQEETVAAVSASPSLTSTEPVEQATSQGENLFHCVHLPPLS